MNEYKTFIVEYVAQVEGRKFKTNTRLFAFNKEDAIDRSKKNNKMFVELLGVVTVK